MAVAAALRGDVLMIKIGGYPASGTVTVVALRRGWQVIEILAHSRNAIVTTTAGT